MPERRVSEVEHRAARREAPPRRDAPPLADVALPARGSGGESFEADVVHLSLLRPELRSPVGRCIRCWLPIEVVEV